MAHETGDPIPVLRPLLPKAAALLPYLERIDESRIYSNWGPLVAELGSRLCDKFQTPEGSVICANSGMSALMGGIFALAGRARKGKPLAIVPDFTFTATGLAAQLCGYELVLASCSQTTWAFEPEALLAQPALLEKVGVIVPVAPFGRPVAQAPWQRFRDVTGIPVVIDAAACFESLLQPPRDAVGTLPIALSFHATKSFASGEGGCVITTDPVLAEKVVQCLNFGFLKGRNTEACGFNGKMSEYAAAVGLAALDGWGDQQRRTAAVSEHYGRAFEQRGIGDRLVRYPGISSSYVLLACRSKQEARRVMDSLARERIDTRLWYGEGLRAHDLFRGCEKVDLHGAEALDAATVVGLPAGPDLSAAQAGRIADVIHNALQ